MTLSRITVVSHPTDVYESFANNFLRQVESVQSSNRTLKLILPVGPTAQYPIIADQVNRRNLSLKNLRIVLMDEYLDWQGRPLPATHHLSFRGQFQSFLNQVKTELRPHDEHWIVPNPFNIDAVDEFISTHGEIDTCYGGIGVHGHIAFNEPPVSRYGQISLSEFRNSETRVVVLASETVTINALRSNHGKFSDFPRLAVTIGMKHIIFAKQIRLYADGGSRQHEALRQFVDGNESVLYPITLLKNHPDVHIVVDQITGSELHK